MYHLLTTLLLTNFGALHDEIMTMHDADQLLRTEWIQEKKEEIATEILVLDIIHQERLSEIIEKEGWLGADRIGEEGAHALWLLVQHSPDVEFQTRCLPLLQQAAEKGQALLKDYAFLQDRVLVRRGEAQIYGTQTAIVEGRVVFFPIQDEEDVEVRRFEVGLNTLWEQAVETTKRYQVRTESGQNSQ
ncbi:MAG: hypothetical protein K940chlam2_00654 [Chlamydiae bacterium]|nr:hypothetical protein [Chlamydiota bacterium]